MGRKINGSIIPNTIMGIIGWPLLSQNVKKMMVGMLVINIYSHAGP
jgi:hypothetical protein